MKLLRLILRILVCVVVFGCSDESTDDPADNNNNGPVTCWNESWLIGTWEGTTPGTITPFANTKIRIVFTQSNLEKTEVVQGETYKVWAYNGVFTWNADGANAWSMEFKHANWPLPDYNVIIWGCLTMSAANMTMDNVSIRIMDTTTVDPSHEMDLDWELISDTNTAPTYFDMFGDIEITTNNVLARADYPPTAGSMIRMTKK